MANTAKWVEETKSELNYTLQTMPVGVMMFAEPQSMIVLTNGECWLIPSVYVYNEPSINYNTIMGVERDSENKYTVYARNLQYSWKKLDVTEGCFLSVKEILPAPSYVYDLVNKKEYITSLVDTRLVSISADMEFHIKGRGITVHGLGGVASLDVGPESTQVAAGYHLDYLSHMNLGMLSFLYTNYEHLDSLGNTFEWFKNKQISGLPTPIPNGTLSFDPQPVPTGEYVLIAFADHLYSGFDCLSSYISLNQESSSHEPIQIQNKYIYRERMTQYGTAHFHLSCVQFMAVVYITEEETGFSMVSSSSTSISLLSGKIQLLKVG